MKKIALLLLVFIPTFCGFAQLSSYTFQQNSEAYVEIEGGTKLGNEATDTQYFVDATVPLGSSTNFGVGLPIGFNFVFNGTIYDRFGISTDGWISLGISTVSPSVGLSSTGRFRPLASTSPNIPTSASPNPLLGSRIAALTNVNLAAQVGATLRYETIGSAPNRTLVVQWKNFRKNTTLGFGDGDFYNFQIRLQETTNTVSIAYGPFTNNANSADYEVGLRAAPLDTPSNYATRTSSTGWSNTVAGTIVKISGTNVTVDKITMNSTMVPASGLTYIWTPPACGNPKDLVVSSIAADGAILNWSSNTPAPSEFEYLVSASAIPPIVSGTKTTSPNGTVSGLDSNTKYYVYLRSDCGSGYNSWILGGTFKTKCNDVAYFYENFDSYNYLDKVMPNCWENTGTTGDSFVQLYQVNQNLGSTPNKLYLKGNGKDGEKKIAYAILPTVSNLQAGSHRLKFTAFASDIERSIDVGYFADAGTFVSLQTINLASASGLTVAPEYIIEPKGIPAGVKSLAFRNSGVAVGETLAYIDDVVWEPIPACPDVKNIVVKGFTDKSVDLSWTKAGTETAWQYAVGSPTQSDPNVLPVLDFNSAVATGTEVAATANGLTGSTSYKIWIRSKCHDGFLGTWIGPVTFSTACASVSEFMQNFDASEILPSCWSKVGTTGTAAITLSSNPASPSAPYVLRLTNSAPTEFAMVSMPPINNSGAGTHRLRFKMRGSHVDGSLLIENDKVVLDKDGNEVILNVKVDIGYLTNVTDPNTFVYLQSFSASSTTAYNEILTNLGSDPKSPYLAFRSSSSAYTSVYIDDVIWEQTPVCKDISGLSVIEIVSTSIKLGWTKGASEGNWQYALGGPTATDPSKLDAVDFVSPAVADISVNGSVNNLNPSTSYKVWVRSKCSGVASFGAWIGPIAFSTTCPPVTNFVQAFDASTDFPSCWGKVGTGGSASIASVAGAPTLPNALSMKSSSPTSPAVVVMQPVSNAGNGTHRLKFKFKGSAEGAVLQLGYLINASDAASFSLLQTFTADSKFESKTVELGFDPTSEFLAFRNGDSDYTVYIDDVVWEAIPTAVPAAATGIKAMPHPSCGNFATIISWNHVAGVSGYKVSVGTAAGLSDVVDNEDLGDVLSYSFMGSANSNYYYTVKPYNAFGSAKVNPENTFVTNANGCYCASTPLSTDGDGIVKVQIGATTFPNTAKGYYDYTSKQVNLAQGRDANLIVKLNTGAYSSKTNVWIDFNDDYNFESSELVSSGMSSLVMPYDLNVSFMMPADAKLGPHRMRIASARTGQDNPNPCYSFIMGVTLDFKVNVILPVANDEATGAAVLTPGKAFADNAITGTNIGATGSVIETEPGCGGYNGDDVWYSATVPASGNLTFEINSVAGGITNSSAAAYYGLTDNLYLIDCNDSGSSAGDDHAKITVTGRTPGETIYLRVWENGGDAFGSFKVSAYDLPLSMDAFDEINFSYYPNPVNDVLNLSFNQDITNVAVVNLLGQQVLFKAINDSHAKIDMSGLPKGTYLVKVAAGNQSKAIKVIKE